MPLALGDPRNELIRAAERLWGKAGWAPLPDAGMVGLDFGYGEKAEAFAGEIHRFCDEALTPELVDRLADSLDGFDRDLNRKLGKAGLLFPDWPGGYGGGGGGGVEKAGAG